MSHLDILQAFDHSAGAISAAEIVSRTGLPRSTVFRSLRALVGSGFLHQEPGSRKYTLGPRILQLGMAARRQLSADDAVAVPLLALLEQTKETVTFSILDVPWRLCTYMLEAPNDIRQVAQVGARYPLHLGAASKVMLAQLPPELAQSIVRHAEMSESQASELLAQLPEIRAKRYAITGGERVPGAAAIAAPVFVHGQIFGSVAMTGPADRVREVLDTRRPEVIEAARAITERLSASSDMAPRPKRRARASDELLTSPSGP